MNLEERRSNWLRFAKKLAIMYCQRFNILRELCPSVAIHCDGAAKLSDLASVNKEIDEALQQLEIAEIGNPPLGSAALIDNNSNQDIRGAVVLLVLSRMSNIADLQFRQLNELIDYVAGNSPEKAFTLRQAFTHHSGVLSQWVTIDRAIFGQLDRSDVAIHDYSWSKAMGEPPSDEQYGSFLLANSRGHWRFNRY